MEKSSSQFILHKKIPTRLFGVETKAKEGDVFYNWQMLWELPLRQMKKHYQVLDFVIPFIWNQFNQKYLNTLLIWELSQLSSESSGVNIHTIYSTKFKDSKELFI